MAKLLTKLAKADIPFVFGEKEEQAFTFLKKALCERPVLTIFDPTLPTELHVDASDEGIIATLMQVKSGVKRVVAYYFRSVSTRTQL